MQFIRNLVLAIQDMKRGRQVMKQRRQAYAYGLMEQGICLIPQEESRIEQYASRALSRGIGLATDIVRDFSN